MKHSIFQQTVTYNIKKIFREGYHYIDVGEERSSLSLADRTLLGVIGKTWNLPGYFRRKGQLRATRRTYAPCARMADGYALVRQPQLPGLDEALSVCDEKITLYRTRLAGQTRIGDIGDIAAYDGEAAKTRDDPLKHAPYLYDKVAAKAIIRPFLAPELVLAAAEHLGVLPVLTGVRILYSPNAPSDALASAQLFHMDPEGARQVKVFIAVQDVGPQNSPFTFVPEGLTRRLLDTGEPVYLGRRVTDKAILKHVAPPQWVSHEGRRGDMLLVDTSRCFHFGSRPNSQPRMLLYAQYLDPFCSMYPATRPAGKVARSHRFYDTADPIEQSVLGRR